MTHPLACRFGLHRWRTVFIGIRRREQTCERCSKTRSIIARAKIRNARLEP